MKIICTICPKGCEIDVEKQGNDIFITGNRCKRGYEFVLEEITCPKRNIQTTVATTFKNFPRLPVKTDKPIDQEKIPDIMKICQGVLVKEKVRTGDIIIENINGTGVNMVATSDMNLRIG